MSSTLFALVGFAAWTGLLVFGLANLRLVTSLSSGKALNSFAPGGDDLEGLGRRWTRAHLNCLEFLPIFGAVGLSAHVSGNAAITDPLAMVVLYVRLGQSIVHLIGTSVPLVFLRAGLFVVQLAIVLWWAYRLLTA